DTAPFDVLKVDTEDFATQLTLLDRDVFRKIRPEELTSCGWNKRNKMAIAPNVVAFTCRFNHVSLWVVREVLRGRTARHRAELVSHFVRLGKRLQELGNLHGACAVLSALQSAPVFRLGKTWAQVGRRERQSLARLARLFSEQDNFGALRRRLEAALSVGTPCLPHLGLYLRDLLHLELARPPRGAGPDWEQRLGATLEALGSLQRSCLRLALTPLPPLQAQLARPFYLEELQKFLEEDHYRESLRLEPPGRQASLTLLPVPEPGASAAGLSLPWPQPRFTPGHRKARSLGTKRVPARKPRARTRARPALLQRAGGGTVCGASDQAAHRRQRAGAPAHLGGRPPRGRPVPDHRVVRGGPGSLPGALGAARRDPTGVGVCLPRPSLRWEEDCGQPVVCQGCLRRKTVLKEGRRPAVSSWLRYWVELRGTSLMFYSPKSLRAKERSDFKRQPCKQSSVAGWLVVPCAEDADSFQLLDPARGSRYKFRPGSGGCSAHDWCSYLRVSAARLPNAI
ncbi:RAL guanine nucleotide exchange factor with PH domain and SH3 binding motif (RALGPS), putative, partial [Ixodes scapularis]